jgi:hypothetical protein
METNVNELLNPVDISQIIHELPPNFKEELFFYQYGDVIKDLQFFQNVDSNEAKW